MTNTESTSTLPVMEYFYTIQGEGYHSGEAAFFIRLAGCDVGCVWCDVKDSWEEEKHPRVKITSLLDEALKHPCKNVVITGGEPLMHDLTELTAAFKSAGFQLWIETSGAHPLSGHWDWICVSPKKFKAPLADVLAQADELKAVVFNTSDFKWGEEQAAKVKPSCKLFFQPEWDKRQQSMELIVEYVKEHPQWRVSLQTHKYLDIP